MGYSDDIHDELTNLKLIRDSYEYIFMNYICRGYMKIRKLGKKVIDKDCIDVMYQVYSDSGKVYSLTYSGFSLPVSLDPKEIGINESSFTIRYVSDMYLRKGRRIRFFIPKCEV